MISVHYLFVCFFIQLLDPTHMLSQCHYDANDPSVHIYLTDQLNCMVSPRPLYWRFGFGLVISEQYALKQNTFPIVYLPVARTQHEMGFNFLFFPHFSCVAALLSHPFLSLACSFISLSLFFSGWLTWQTVSNQNAHRAYALNIINVPCRYYMALIELINCDMQAMPIDSRWKRK